MKKYLFLLFILYCFLLSSCKKDDFYVIPNIELTLNETIGSVVEIKTDKSNRNEILEQISYKYDSQYLDENKKAIKTGETVIYTCFKNRKWETKVHINDTKLDFECDNTLDLAQILCITPTNIGSRNIDEIQNNMKITYDSYYFNESLKALNYGITEISIEYDDIVYKKTINIIDKYEIDREFLYDFKFYTYLGYDYLILESYKGTETELTIPKTLLGLKVKYVDTLLASLKTYPKTVITNLDDFEVTTLKDDADRLLKTEVYNEYSAEKYSEGYQLYKEAKSNLCTICDRINTKYSYCKTSSDYLVDDKVTPLETLEHLYIPSNYLGYNVLNFTSALDFKDSYNNNLTIHVSDGISSVMIANAAKFDLPKSLRRLTIDIVNRNMWSSGDLDLDLKNESFDYLGMDFHEISFCEIYKFYSPKHFTEYTDQNDRIFLYFGTDSNPYLIYLGQYNSSESHEPILIHDDCLSFAESSFEFISSDIILGKKTSFLNRIGLHKLITNLTMEQLDNIKYVNFSGYYNESKNHYTCAGGYGYLGTKENPYYLCLGQFATIGSNSCVSSQTKKLFTDGSSFNLSKNHQIETIYITELYSADSYYRIVDRLKELCPNIVNSSKKSY